MPKLARLEPDHVPAPEDDLPTNGLGRWRQQPADAEQERRLAAPRLAHDPEELALVDREADPVDSADVGRLGPVLDGQVDDLKQRTGHANASFSFA